MNKSLDLRIVKTKKAFYSALLKLMEQKPFEEIKVLDICNEAIVNRSTFYAHYNDKYELLAEFIDTLKNNLTLELAKNTSIKNSKEYYLEMISLLLNYINKEKDTYFSIMINNKKSITMDILYDVINKDIINQIKMKNNIKDTKIPINIISQFYLGAVINVCLEWLKNNNKYAIEEILEYLNLLLPDNLY